MLATCTELGVPNRVRYRAGTVIGGLNIVTLTICSTIVQINWHSYFGPTIWGPVLPLPFPRHNA